MKKIFTKFSLLITLGLLSTLFSTDYTFVQNPGNALDFDGSNDYVSIPDATALDITKQITIELATVVSNVPVGWPNSGQNTVFYNGSNFFLLYTKGDGSIYYKSSSDNVTWSGESTLVSDQDATASGFGIFLVDDTKLDLGYYDGSYIVARTATISGADITVGGRAELVNDAGYSSISVVVARAAGRIYVAIATDGDLVTASANGTGDAGGFPNDTDWDSGIHGNDGVETLAMVPYATDQVLIVEGVDKGGSNSDGLYYHQPWTHGSFNTNHYEVGNLDAVPDISNAVRIADSPSDFRVIARVPGGAMVEHKRLGNNHWSSVPIDTETDQTSPSLFYDPISGDMYAFSIDTGASPDQVERHKKIFAYFSFAAQSPYQEGISFNDDGSKMYMIGQLNGIYQYSLSTPWDIVTASYNSVSFLAALDEDGSLREVTFKDDGTKMYVLGSQYDKVFQYSLSTAWDISTASYDAVSFPVSTDGETTPNDITFKDDGTRMYMVGSSTDAVYQYELSTAWDLGTASYNSVSFSIFDEDSGPQSLAFKDDGTKMYVMGGVNREVFQYSLSTAWNPSTASYDDVSFPFTGYGSAADDVAFNDDGTKMYVLGSQFEMEIQYTLSTAWDITTASYAGVWETEIVADADPEAYDASFPITQMHEPPYGSSRTTPRVLVWAYRVANGANFDLRVRTLTGAGGGGGGGGPAQVTTGKIGNAQDFDGVNDYIEIPNSATLENVNEGDYTIESWFSPDQVPPGVDPDNDARYEIVAKEGWNEGLGVYWLNRYYIDHYTMWDEAEVWAGGLGLTNTWAPGTFRHVVGVVSKTYAASAVYVDGQGDGMDAFPPGTGTTAREYGTTPWRIGIGIPDAAQWRWAADGKIDEVRISSVARSGAWIAASYNNQDDPSTFVIEGTPQGP